MKVAITGGTGFLGRPLAEALRAEGHALVLLSRRPEAVPQAPGLESAFFDPLKPIAAEDLRGAEAVIHLAAEPIDQRWSRAARERIRRSRVEGTRSIVAAAREAGTVKVLVSASGINFYGDRGTQPLNESSPAGDDFLASVCREWEAAALPAADAGIRTVRMRTGPVLHPEGGALKKMLLPFRLGVGGPVGSGEQYLSWIHREDAVGLFLHALRTESLKGAVNVTAPHPVTNREFSRALGRALRRPALMPVPTLALRALYGEMAELVVGGQRVLPQRALESGYAFRFPDIEGALRHLLSGGQVA